MRVFNHTLIMEVQSTIQLKKLLKIISVITVFWLRCYYFVLVVPELRGFLALTFEPIFAHDISSLMLRLIARYILTGKQRRLEVRNCCDHGFVEIFSSWKLVY